MFRNRGPIPGNNGNVSNPACNPKYRRHYSLFWRRRYIIINYDKTFMLMELLSFLLIAVIIIGTLFWAYPITFEDPIASVKSDFLKLQLIMIGISISAMAMITIFAKNHESLYKALKSVAIITILMIIVQIVMKLDIDSKYNAETFSQFYEQIKTNDNDNKKHITIGLSGMSLKSDKENYIQKSISAFNNFKMKTLLYIILHIVIEMVIIYLIYRLKIMERKKERLEKDDIILEDEEQNIRY